MNSKNKLIIFLILLYFEIISKIFLKFKIIELSNIFLLVTIFFYCSLILLATYFIKTDKNKNKLLIILFSVIAFLYSTQVVLSNFFGFFFSLNLLSATGQIFEFKTELIGVIVYNLIYILLFYLPIFGLFLRKDIPNDLNYKKINYKEVALNLALSILLLLSLPYLLIINKKTNYSNYDLVYKYNDINLSVKNLGVINSFFIDVYKYFSNFEEAISSSESNKNETPPKESKLYETNVLDLTFDTLAKDLDNYFINDSGTYQNEYTGIFEGKNLVLILAESFSEIAVLKEYTPTLFKLVNEGFNFTNYYSPTIKSTIGGEFQLLSGLYPANNFIATIKNQNNYYPFGVGNVFKNLNYKVSAYHNHTYNFQARDKYLKNYGFDNYLACRNGLEKRMRCIDVGHTSDISLIDVTTDDYINTDLFFTYYVTVSGHAIGDPPTYLNTCMTSRKYVEETNKLKASSKIRAYMGSQMELDNALKLLIERLEEANKLDDTVIVLAADHRPYALTTKEMNELSTYIKDSTIEVDRSNLIIWNNQIKPTKITKVGSTYDVLPTVYNLFGIKYDSRLFVGKDIFSTEPGIAIFGNRSWVSDYGYYYSASNEFIKREDVNVQDDYVLKTRKIVDNKIAISGKILTNNYYNLIGELK